MPSPPQLDLSSLEPRESDTLAVPDFLGYTARSWVELMHRDGPIFKASMPDGEFVIVCGHEADLAAWQSPANWIYGPPSSGGNFFISELGELHISQLDGEAHRRARKLILPAFGVNAVLRDLEVVADTISEGLALLADKTVNLHPELSLIFARALSKSQVKADVSDDELRKVVAFEESFIPASSLSPAQREKWYSRPQYITAKAKAFEIFNRVVEARLGGERSNDSFDLIIDRDVPMGMAPMCEEELIRTVYLLLVAGVGNIANLFSAIVWGITTHPVWIDRLREELENFKPEQLKSGVKNLPVVRAVISESERCFLPAPVVPKMTAKDVNLLGFNIPRGTNVLHLHGLAHFEASRYQDPFGFRPERWLEQETERPNAFGGGVHLCLGMGVTRLYLPLTLALLVSRYDWVADVPPVFVPQDPDVDYSPKTTSFPIRLSART